MSDDDALDVVDWAERIVYAASWRVREETVLQGLAGIRGLACARLEPSSEVIQLVTYDGEHLGHIRHETNAYSGERWVAVLKDEAKIVGLFPSALTAAEALAQAAGKTTPSAG